MSGRFRIRFYNASARKDYKRLDGSQRKLVNIALRKLETRADELGEPLRGPLAGCKKLKWRRDGLRMVFRLGDDGAVEIVEIIAIGRRDKSAVYRRAEQRLSTGE